MNIVQDLSDFNPMEIDVHLIYKGRKIGECFITQFNVYNDVTCRDNGGAMTRTMGAQTMTIEACLKGALEL